MQRDSSIERPLSLALCRGTGWVAWVQDLRGEMPSLVAVASAGPPNLLARPCPECRASEAKVGRDREDVMIWVVTLTDARDRIRTIRVPAADRGEAERVALGWFPDEMAVVSIWPVEDKRP